MPADSGSAFVVVQHLDPTHESLLPELLARHTSMDVVQVLDEARVEPNRVYVIPPGRYLTIKSGALRLEEPDARNKVRAPVDVFLRSLAKECQGRAVSVLLSGTGSDGTLGLGAIKGAGGLTIAQDPAEAEYSGMPDSAIATGEVDLVLAVEKMPQALLEYLRHPYSRDDAETPVIGARDQDDLQQILDVLSAQTPHDFRGYKKSMLRRRIRRRMGVKRVERAAEYLSLLRDEEKETRALCQDLLIGVTSFFRDPGAFDALIEHALGPLVRNLDGEVRVWVPGCSSGEEPYSIAMVLLDMMSGTNRTRSLRVFATDVDEGVLQSARAGIYPESIALDLSPAYLQRFFSRKGSHYHVNPGLRDRVTFAVQDLLHDPPFSKLDLISCRNLLIYLEPDVQEKVISLFHYALKNGGYLFLGTAETIGPQDNLFEPVAKQERVYRRIEPAGRHRVSVRVLEPKHLHSASAAQASPGPRSKSVDLARRTERLLLREYAPAAAVVNRKLQILHLQGATDRYLELPTGEPTRDLLAMARRGLRLALGSAIREAFREDRVVSRPNVRVLRNGTYHGLKLTVRPMRLREADELLALVVWEDEPASAPSVDTDLRTQDGTDDRMRHLEAELDATQKDLSSAIDELQDGNEHLLALNEEATAANEELQSTNEELETSKEELQSVNEELVTVNLELQAKMAELESANSDLRNLFDSTNIATIFLDHDLRIRRFTPATEELLQLIPADLGRPIAQLASELVERDLWRCAEKVLENAEPIERQIEAPDGRTFVMQFRPYRGQRDELKGVVVTFIDVTELKRADALDRRLATVVRDSSDAVTLQDLDGNILAWNEGAEKLYGYTEAEALAMNVRELLPEDRREEAREAILRVARGEVEPSLEQRRVTKDGRSVDVWLTVTRLTDDDGATHAVATTERDLSRITFQMETLGVFAAGVAHDFNNILTAILGSTEIALDQLDPASPVRTEIEEIKVATRRAAELSVQMLAYSRGRSMALERVLLSDLVLEMASLLRSTIPKTANLEHDLAEDLPHVEGNPTQLRQVIMNLVINAADAYGGEGGTVTVCVDSVHCDGRELKATLGTTLPEGHYVRLRVGDTGAGMSRQLKERIFDPFFSTKPGGRGLGLAAVLGIVRSHRGAIRIDSEPGLGTTVSLYLPAAEEPAPSTGPADTGAKVSCQGRGETILVVDDEELIRKLYERHLESFGFRVVTATNGREAVDVFSKLADRIVLTLLDLNMPVMGGEEAFERIRRRSPDAKIVLASGYIEDDISERVTATGLVSFLQKPFSRESLCRVISEVLGPEP